MGGGEAEINANSVQQAGAGTELGNSKNPSLNFLKRNGTIGMEFGIPT